MAPAEALVLLELDHAIDPQHCSSLFRLGPAPVVVVAAVLVLVRYSVSDVEQSPSQLDSAAMGSKEAVALVAQQQSDFGSAVIQRLEEVLRPTLCLDCCQSNSGTTKCHTSSSENKANVWD